MEQKNKILIISHTEHYCDENGRIVGWGSTIREINYLLNVFEEIWHIAPLYNDKPPASALPYSDYSRIHFVPIKPTGGKTIMDKLGILFSIFSVIHIVNSTLKKVDIFQFRSPTGIGVFLIPWLSIGEKKRGWFKYAGNWIDKKLPWSYNFQRFYLTYFQKRTVTINGKWPDQKRHLLSFENPCLNEKEREIGWNTLDSKVYSDEISICFVGHLTEHKGAHWILDALESLNITKIKKFHIVGNGVLLEDFKRIKPLLSYELKLHGYCSRDEVAEIMKECHFVLLPSKAEGFPKVIAEGANYGCIPIVSNISAISQYIQHGQNGFLLDLNRLHSNLLFDDLSRFINEKQLRRIAENAYDISKKFTFNYYNESIKKRILNDDL